MESVGGFGLPLAAFAAGFAAPDRVGAISQNLQFMAEMQHRQKQFEALEQERRVDREFREKSFASTEAERADIGQTRAQQREAAGMDIARARAQREAGSLLPQLQFSRDVSVGQPEIPPVLGSTSDVLRGQGRGVTVPGMPGAETRVPQAQTVEELRRQIEGLAGAPPDVRAELFREVLKSGAPVVPPAERPEIQRHRQAVAAEQFLAPQMGAVPARRTSELIRTGAAQLPPNLIERAASGDVRTVDRGQFVEFFDVANNRSVAALSKTPFATPHLVTNPIDGRVRVLMVDPQGGVTSRETSVIAKHPLDVPFNTARLVLAAIAVGKPLPNTPPEFADYTPEEAKKFLAELLQRKQGDAIDKMIEESLAGAGTTPPKAGAPAPKAGAKTPQQEAEEYLRRKPATPSPGSR